LKSLEKRPPTYQNRHTKETYNKSKERNQTHKRDLQKRPTKEITKKTYRRDLQKRPTKLTTVTYQNRPTKETVRHQKRPTKETTTETNKIDLYTSKETNKRDLQKRPTKETYKRDLRGHWRPFVIEKVLQNRFSNIKRDLQKRLQKSFIDIKRDL